jgi:pyruvate dehydrogenase E2 component (dihydrolipoamide acetyltransferase)
MEVEAPIDGILAGIQAQAGDMVPVTAVIAYIIQPGERVPDAPSTQPASHTTAVAASATPVATPVAMRMAQEEGVDLNQISGSGPAGRIQREDVARYLATQPSASDKVRATPAARRIARENEIDLETVKGSGPNGRIQSEDVNQAKSATSPTPPQPAPTASADQRMPLSTMRRTIGRNLQRSMQEAPHVTFQIDVDMTAVLALSQRATQRRPADAGEVTITAVLTKAVAWALGQHPLLNSSLEDDEIVLHSAINIGIAVAIEDGLLVPVVKQADGKGISQISDEIRGLATRARQGKLKGNDLSDGTFTISNLGMFGVDRFMAIINPPQVGILAVGRTSQQFRPDGDGQPGLTPICTMTLSVDHRVVDGAVAARFLADLRTVLEQPDIMLT